MFSKVVLCLSTLHLYSVAAQGECTDLRGRLISNGLHYVPGPDTCTLCVCDNGLPKVCKAVLCSPPQDCRSFRLGSTCCEFICLDDVVKPVEATEANVRLAAGGAAAILLITVALFVYKLRKQERRRPPHLEDQRSLTSIGYISGSYMGASCESAPMGAWKPPSNYLPRGEAPPPYEEAMAQCREPMRITNETSFHRSYPTVDPRDDVCASHAYVNIPRPIAQIANTQNCYNAPLLQPVHDAAEATVIPHPLAQNMGGVVPGARLTGSLGAISARLSVPRDDHERPHNVPGFYATHTALHRTIPRISTAVDTSTLEAMGFTRADRSLAGEVRRSFHRPDAARAERIERVHSGRSVPRNLNIASVTDAIAMEPADDTSQSSVRTIGRPRAHSDEQDKPKQPEAPPTLPLTVDKPSCVCSYEGARDADDYRSECENCHSATNNSGWEEGGGSEGSGWGGTQTLQRRAPPPPAPPPATATLPQPVTRHGRNGMGNPSNWENWFNTIPDSDTESEEE